MENNQKQPEKLRIQSSVYPEGWNTNNPAAYNAIWANIFEQSAKAMVDPRHKKSPIMEAHRLN